MKVWKMMFLFNRGDFQVPNLLVVYFVFECVGWFRKTGCFSQLRHVYSTTVPWGGDNRDMNSKLMYFYVQ